MKPIWLLDVDGVINCFDETSPAAKAWPDFAEFQAKKFRIRYSRTMLNLISMLHEHEACEVRWLTTWGRLANIELKELNLPEFAVAGEQPFREKTGWWKLPIVQDLFSKGHPIIWTDDDLNSKSDAQQWINSVRNTPRSTELLTICPREGALTPEHLTHIQEWLQA